MSERVTFTGAAGHELTGILDRPDGPVRAGALVVHCFPEGADDVAAAWVARALAEQGYLVLRVDISGSGDGAAPAVCVSDLVSATDDLRRRGAAPALLIGHSLGGAAVVAAAQLIREARAVAVIGMPADPARFLEGVGTGQQTTGGEVPGTIGGRPVTIHPALAADLATRPQASRLAGLGRPLLLLHAPQDDVVGIDDARIAFEWARHPKSFIALDGADHHLSRPEDALFVARVLSAWADRYVGAAPASAAAPPGALAAGTVHVRESGAGRYQQEVRVGAHRWTADEPVRVGGDDAGPSPYDMLLAGLGACTSMTLRMYVERKGWDVGPIDVVVRHDKVPEEGLGLRGVAGRVDRMRLAITVDGALDETQRESILRIAGKCPVHRTLTHDVLIQTELAGEPG